MAPPGSPFRSRFPEHDGHARRRRSSPTRCSRSALTARSPSTSSGPRWVRASGPRSRRSWPRSWRRTGRTSSGSTIRSTIAQRPRQRQRPLPHGHGGNHPLDQMRGQLAPAATAAGGADAVSVEEPPGPGPVGDGLMRRQKSADVTSLAIRGGTLVDDTGRPPLPDAVAVIDDGRISRVDPAATTPVPEGRDGPRHEREVLDPGPGGHARPRPGPRPAALCPLRRGRGDDGARSPWATARPGRPS